MAKPIQILVDAAYKGAGAIKKANADIKDLGAGAEKASGGVGRSFKAIGIAGAALGASLGTIAVAGKMAFDALEQGSALVDARGDFEDLTASIGITADAMESQLGSATAGLVSNADNIANASNLMALNLGLTADEIVAFSGAAAELDWDMGQLADTLNTGATRGLKEMGLNIDFVKTRMAELEAQGVATDEAFRMAILEAAGQKMEAVGKKSEEAAGQFQKLTVMWTDATDAFKEEFAAGVSAQILEIGAATDDTAESMVYAAEAAAQFAASLTGGALESLTFVGQMKAFGDLSREVEAAGGDLDEFKEKYASLFSPGGRAAPEQVAAGIADLTAELASLADASRRANPELNDVESSSLGAGDAAVDAARDLSEWTQEAKDAAIASAELSGELAGLDLAGVAGATQSGIWAAAGGHIQSILDDASAAADEEAAEIAAAFEEAFRDAALRSSGYFTDAMSGLQDWQVPDLVTPERDVSYTVSGPSQDQLNLMEEYQERYDDAATAAYELSVGLGTVGLSQEQLNERIEKANAEMGHYSGLMAGLQLPATQTATAHQDLAFNMDMVGEAMYGAGEKAGWSVTQIADLGVATGQFTPQAADAAIKTALFYSALDILAQERKLGNLDTTEYMTAVDQLVSDLENNSIIDLQVKLAQVENPARELWAWLPAEERQVDVPVTFTSEQSALQTALDTLDGIPDNDEKLITFGAVYEDVTPAATDEIQTAITAIDGTVTFDADYTDVTPDATGAIQRSIEEIDGTVRMIPDAQAVYNTMNDIDGTRLTVYVDYVSTGEPVVKDKTRSGPSTKNGPAMKGGPAIANLNVNFYGPAEPAAVKRAVYSGVEQFYADVVREGLDW